MPCKIVALPMSKQFILLCITCVLSILAKAQVNTVLVGKQQLDNNTVQAIQLVQPGFSLYGDSAAIATNTLKFYTLNKYLAERSKAAKQDTTAGLREKIALAQQVLAEKMLAEEYMKQQLEKITVTEQEAVTYYKAHLSQFSTPGYRNFFLAQTSDTSSSIIKEIKQFVAMRANNKEQQGDTKIANDKYFITFSNYYSNNKQAPLYNEITSAKEGTWIGPYVMPGTNGFFYYYIMDGVAETYMPYEQVKETCMQQVRSQKASNLLTQWGTEAQKMYPVKVKADAVPTK